MSRTEFSSKTKPFFNFGLYYKVSDWFPYCFITFIFFSETFSNFIHLHHIHLFSKNQVAKCFNFGLNLVKVAYHRDYFCNARNFGVDN